jgi:electron transport complex protein RnfG
VREITKMLIVLTVIATVSGSGLAVLERMTRESIEYQKLKLVKGPAVLAILSGYDNNPVKDVEKDVLLQESEDQLVRKSLFPARKEGKPFAVAFEMTGQGYGGKLEVMIGIDLASGKLLGMRVTTHSETPGLGARSTDAQFYEQFSGLTPEEVELASKGGTIDAISGATVTSTGVVRAVREGLELFSQSKGKIAAALQSG